MTAGGGGSRNHSGSGGSGNHGGGTTFASESHANTSVHPDAPSQSNSNNNASHPDASNDHASNKNTEPAKVSDKSSGRAATVAKYTAGVGAIVGVGFGASKLIPGFPDITQIPSEIAKAAEDVGKWIAKQVENVYNSLMDGLGSAAEFILWPLGIALAAFLGIETYRALR